MFGEVGVWPSIMLEPPAVAFALVPALQDSAEPASDAAITPDKDAGLAAVEVPIPPSQQGVEPGDDLRQAVSTAPGCPLSDRFPEPRFALLPRPFHAAFESLP